MANAIYMWGRIKIDYDGIRCGNVQMLYMTIILVYSWRNVDIMILSSSSAR